uniref:Si:ch211-191i18.4 n=1 Tax=Sinocyclocheilus grahami TaxID=75366 RepID=A0A672R3P2_SINGR
MSNLSVLLVALHCAVYIYSKISGVDSRPPDYEPTGPFTDDAPEAVSGNRLLRAGNLDRRSLDNRKTSCLFQTRAVTEYNANLQRQVVLKRKFNRLPGVCRRLKRRRITILCNTAKFCSATTRSQHGHICSCPKGSKCTHFFLWSL